MNIQIYYVRKDFDTRKAERFFKERQIPCQLVDMLKRRPGKRELALFAGKHGARALLDTQSSLVKSHPAAYTEDTERILEYVMERPELLKTPLIRDGTKTLIGFDEEQLLSWLSGR